ncbi:Vms1/Ankzf1 family peptidyl-tRNA hydrolase [Halopiger thermotolerans]
MFDLDELLGRAELKERIDELEDETERLRERYEAESERRADAARARQEAEEEINRLEDRIAQLEGELERTETGDGGLDVAVRRRERLRGRRLEAVLDRLESFRTDAEGALTTVIGADADRDDLDGDLADLLGERTALLADAAPCVCCVDDAGIVSVALEPPVLPDDSEVGWRDRFALEREWFLPTGRHALALVRTDLFALGIYEGDERVDYRGFESDVKGSHSKGGFSQARFERLRNEQIDEHLDRCREALEEYVGAGSADGAGEAAVDRLFLVGQRGVVDALVDESGPGLEPDATAAVDATGDPKSALEDAHHSFWTTELTVL